ncbi:TPA: hypothetical protein N0F65_004206 [Lagenidium giganteum]|uniref:Phosphatidylinositol-3-phosphatase n=1 Tax=Lagenidium giganteum TaxID=4803 RepID=A0AAV2YF57_9STRA|nr:TPA: hypothetical protein N0F65_004206 [Lagenidium giganteum]
MSASFGVCTAITHAGTRCTTAATDASGKCAHHARMARVMALAPKPSTPKNAATTPTPTPMATTTASATAASSAPSSGSAPSVFTFDEPKRELYAMAPAAASAATASPAPVGATSGMLPGEAVASAVNCSFMFPSTLNLPALPGTLFVTNYRLRFEPLNASLRSPGHLHKLLDDALVGIPKACVAKLSYPHASQQRPKYDGTPTQLVLKFKDLRAWTLGGDVNTLMMTLNRVVFVDSPLSLFAFAPTSSRAQHQPVDALELEHHRLYNVFKDYSRMGVDLMRSNYRLCEANKNYNICPTYPPQFVVPASISDAEITNIAEFRSKGRIPICCFVHERNSASIWRCAQPKRGIFNAQNSADERYLLHISQSNRNQRKVWIADCRPELNARANNFTGGGTESSSIPHATVSFLNIANIHSMRESIENVRGLVNTSNTDQDFSWHARVEETKWLLHVRLVLSAAVRVADAVENKQTTVLVHCSDGWDRTGQLCALSQMLLDGHYRTICGFIEIIEKEWLRVGHKFQDRVGPGKTENEEQSPIFLQFLDCVWQIWRQYPTYFEFNSSLLETIADALFSGRYGTFLGNCDRERTMWNLSTRTPSLWTYVLTHRVEFANPFYRAHSEKVLVPPMSSLLRNVTLWSDYYCRGSVLQTVPVANPAPPLWTAQSAEPAKSSSEDLMNAMTAAIRHIQQLEAAMAQTRSLPPPAPSVEQATLLTPSQYTPAPTPSYTVAATPQVSAGSYAPALVTPPASIGATWTCGLCSKANAIGTVKCGVCGRPPPSSS